MVPISYNIRNLMERKGTTLMTAVGIGLTVAVLVVSVALAEGWKSVFAASGDPSHALVPRKGTDAELTSQVSRNVFEMVRAFPQVKQNSNGDPEISAEGLSVVYVVLNNGQYGILKAFAEFQRTPGVPGLDLPRLDIPQIARGFGADARRVTSPDDALPAFQSAFDLAIARQMPVLVDVTVSPEIGDLFGGPVG